jgi:hypothetical protein
MLRVPSDAAERPVTFIGSPIEHHITSKGADINLEDIGLSVSIPEQPLDGVDLLIRPCLSGPFILPSGYELASPVYIIEPSKQGVLQKPCRVRIQHYMKLMNEKDCEGMTFISASISPKTRWYGPYNFKAISKGMFTPGSRVGEIEVSHFCGFGCAKQSGKFHDQCMQPALSF